METVTIPQMGSHWSPQRWAAEARQKRCQKVWDEFCRLIDLREDGRFIPQGELEALWELYLACERDECVCVNPLAHREDCDYRLAMIARTSSCTSLP